MATDPIVIREERNPGKTVVGKPEEDKKAREELIDSRRRINRARKELAKVVRSLPEGLKFTIISYSSDVVPWRRKLAPVKTDTRKEAIDFIEAMKAEGITVTDFALEAAFEDLSVDTIYLITDGAPTHVGSVGPERPRDADSLIESIHRRVKELNFLRGVRIFTLGFPEAEEEFLRKLAAENSGLYTPIE